ncbi:SH2 domain-containing protein 2A isoform X2 [Coregonus clupeaformis]|uniref:SH2 domain-containing protein 2A isoform X2 n=1 Tax=Coregonus clupeaformis TaxID=59861 RepID=UPI001BE0F23C|nr:SH2 domain-containing protein 2A isoform X2 [Coregonus clupeaformis]
MDFDYQRLKDVESLRREERISCLPIQTQKPVPPHHSAEDPPTCQTLPIKPRRSLKVPKTPREEVALPAKQTNGQENETVVKRVSPALTLGRPGPLEPLSPSLRAHTLLWFERTQLPRLRRPGRPMPHWLHGFATRREAEELLKDKQQGCFLLRLSESKIGFVLSYRGMDRCRHFIIEEEEGGRGSCYLIAGEESRHKSLQELVSYYTQYPVGPFNEILTIPFDESSEACEGTVKLGLQDEGGEKTEASSSAPSAPATVQVQEILASSAPTNDGTPEYAVVKKVLKKSRSLPENQLGELLEVTNLILPQDVAKPGVSCAGAFGGGDDASDALYARVNKPPSMLSQTDTSPYVNVCNPPGQKGVTASSVPLMCRGSVGDPVYWKLDPLHTYEETPHLVQREEEEEAKEHIDFHAMGRWRDAERSAGGRDPQHHLYSEVNLRTREAPSHTPLPARTAPNRPLRLPPRPVNCPPQQDGSVQRCGDPILLSSSPSRPGVFLTPCSERPLTENPGTSIYEQIPKRPTSSRPPLPPPNPKP